MKTLIAGLMALVGLTWGWAWLQGGVVPDVNPLWQWRQEGLYLSGLMAIALMSLSMYLSSRPRWLESALGGMDRVYRTHKWAGMLSGGWALSHWLIEMSDDVLKALIGREGRLPRERLGGVLDVLRDLGKDMGEWAIYALLVMLVISLWKRVPYRYWRFLHRTMPGIYLMAAAHAALLAPVNYWQQPVGGLMAVLLLAGSYGALIALLGRIGRASQFSGKIVALNSRTHGVLHLRCQMDAGWRGHQPGQFAFIHFDAAEGAHPFTIAGADRGDGCLDFEIKALGDYTANLSAHLMLGQRVRVEGPYGRFMLKRIKPALRQIWVAGGIGITPFIAWLEALQSKPIHAAAIDLHYCTRSSVDDPFVSRLEILCAAVPGMKLHVHADDQPAGPSLAEWLLSEAGQAGSELWFCGPTGLAEHARQALAPLGMSGPAFHQEAFELR